MSYIDQPVKPARSSPLVRIEWGIRADIAGPQGLTFELFKRTKDEYRRLGRWADFSNSTLSEPCLFDMVAMWTQRFTDDLVMSPGVQLVLPSEA